MNRRLITTLAMGALLTLSSTALAQSTTITYDGKLLPTTEPVIVQNDRTLLALRDYFEALQIKVDWDDQAGSATVHYPAKKIRLEPATGNIYLNDVKQSLDVGVQMIDNKIYVPLRFLSESMDCTVDYSMQNGTTTVAIQSKAPTPAISSKKGDVTTMTRVTTMVDPAAGNPEAADYEQWVAHNTAYAISDDGHLIEVASLGKTVEIRSIDPSTGDVQIESFETGKQNNVINGIEKDGSQFKVIMNQPTSKYLGIGKPLNVTELASFDTAGGKFYLHYGEDSRDVATLSAKDGSLSGHTSDSRAGFTLDLAETFGGVESASYAITPGGTYGFLINETLLIVNKNGDLVYAGAVADNMAAGRIVALDGKFLIIATEKSGSAVNKLYTTIYDTNGDQIAPYFKRTSFDEQRGLAIKDTIVDGNTVHMLLRTNWDHYLATYDTKADVCTMQTLSSPINRLVPTSAGHKALGADSDHYYWQDIH